MTMFNLKRDLAKDVQQKLNSGEKKERIYEDLKGKYSASSVERSLAQWPYPKDKTNSRHLNTALLIIMVIFTLVKILQFIDLFRALGSGQIWNILPAAVLTLAIYSYIIYGIKNGNLIGYLLVLLLGISTLLSTRSFSAANAAPLVLTVVAMVLAWLQKRRLFPNVTLLLRFKRDSNGQPAF